MDEGDQPVGLAATVGGVEPEDRRGLATGAAQPTTHVGEQVPQAARGVGVGEKTGWVAVFRAGAAGDDLREVGREIGLGNAAGQDIRARPAGLEYGRNRHLLPI